jgi:hypothetical protein
VSREEKAATLGAQLEASHRRFVERIRQERTVEALRAVAAKQAELLDLARRGAAENVRLSKAGDRGGRKRKVTPEELVTAFDRYMKQNPGHSLAAADDSVGHDFGVGARTVQRARTGR